ncbi:MAG: DUF2231 domain-containing protein [bacterium]
MTNKQYFICFAIVFFIQFILVPGVGYAHGDETHPSDRSEAQVTESGDTPTGEETTGSTTDHPHSGSNNETSHETESGHHSGNDQSTGHHTSTGESNQEKMQADHHSEKESTGTTDHHSQGGTKTHQKENQIGWLRTLFPGLSSVKNIHPMFVHFPIVFLVTSLLFSVVSWIRDSQFFLDLARWMFWLGLVALPVTVATGFWAVGGWGGGHVTGHRNFMLLTTVLAFVLFGILRTVAGRERVYRIVLTVGLVIVVTFMTLGADRGAWLVFQKGAGVQEVEHEHNH